MLSMVVDLIFYEPKGIWTLVQNDPKKILIRATIHLVEYYLTYTIKNKWGWKTTSGEIITREYKTVGFSDIKEAHKDFMRVMKKLGWLVPNTLKVLPKI